VPGGVSCLIRTYLPRPSGRLPDLPIEQVEEWSCMFTEKMLHTFAHELAPVVADRLREHLAPRIAPRYMSLEKAADYMSTTPGAVRGMLRARQLPQSKIGERVFIDVRDIDRAMKAGKGWANGGRKTSTKTSPRAKEIAVA
jgi:hypothetical protein